MPGYRTLPESVSGIVADLTREAAMLETEGEHAQAGLIYERALCTAAADADSMPAYLCGRLALHYRRLGHHAEEVALLERYQASLRTERERIRFDARLSKAKALMERASRAEECGALSSIRAFGKARKLRGKDRLT
ncbi:MAG: hypothetical protein JWM95_3032 [Gemmatimonadetes bacterium]|nr:hypothetical protein [Gemmatimonadota bacterium]